MVVAITRMKLARLLLVSLVGSATAVPYDDCPAPGTVSRLDQSRGEVLPEEAPSPAPSMAHLCTSQTSNARGHYTTKLAPCVLTFHAVQGEQEDRLIDYQTSNLCDDDNGFLIMKEYVYDWGDECVGDFSRCYSLEHHRDILFDFLCAMDWKIPQETTHVSVNCVEDKTLVLETETHSHKAATQERNQERLERVELKLFNVVLVLGSCLAGIYVISKWIVKPLVVQSSFQLDRGHDDGPPSFCSCSSLETCSCHAAVDGRWIPPHRISLEIDESSSLSEHPEYDTPAVTTSQAEAVHHDFDMQVPADFDAVPIVPATILPDID
jgi:hypothetical protein